MFFMSSLNYSDKEIVRLDCGILKGDLAKKEIPVILSA